MNMGMDGYGMGMGGGWNNWGWDGGWARSLGLLQLLREIFHGFSVDFLGWHVYQS